MNLVERLRRNDCDCLCREGVENDAADRIEALESALRDALEVLKYINRLDDDCDFLEQPDYERLYGAIAKINEVLK